MSELFEYKVNQLNAEVARIHRQIDHINEANENAIAELEAKKKELRKFIDPNSPLIEEHVRSITLGHDKIIEKLIKTKTVEFQLKKTSIEQIDYIIDELDKEISRIQADKNSVVLNLKSKTYKIEDRQRCIENLKNLTGAISRQIKECTRNYKIQMHALWRQKEVMLLRRDLKRSEINLYLAELDWEIVNKQHCHRDYIASMQRQRHETFLKLNELNIEVAISSHLSNELEDGFCELEALKQTPYRQQIDEIKLLRELTYIGLKLTPSDHVVTGSGRILNMKETIAAGFLDGMDCSRLLDPDEKSAASERTLALDEEVDANSNAVGSICFTNI